MRIRGDGQMEEGAGWSLSSKKECGRTCQTEDVELGCIRERAMVVWRGPEHGAQRVELNRDDHGSSSNEENGKDARPGQTQAWTGSMHSGSPKTGTNTTSYYRSTKQARCLETSLLPRKGRGQETGMMRRLRCGSTEAVSKGQIKHGNQNAAYWKPAGPVRQVMHMNFNNRPMKRRTGKALCRGMETRQNAHDCESCPCCSGMRNHLDEQIEENRLIAENLKSKKTTLASSISKLARDKKEFEMFKVLQSLACFLKASNLGGSFFDFILRIHSYILRIHSGTTNQ